jgi:hypothetical protein
MPTHALTAAQLKSRRGIFFSAVIAQVMVPLLLWPVEAANRHRLSDATIALTAPLWSFALATSCRRSEYFIGGLAIAFFQALLFGGFIKEAEAFVMPWWERWGILATMAACGILFWHDRHEAHIEGGEAFGPFRPE